MTVVINPSTSGVVLNSRIPIAQRNGTVATPVATISGSTGTAFTLPLSPLLPPGILANHSQLRIRAVMQRTGANGTANFDAYLGTSNSVSDSRIARVSTAATTLQIVVLDVAAWIGTSSTVVVAHGGLQYNNAATNGQFGDQNTNINTAALMYATLAINTSNALDSFALISYEIWIET